MNSTVKTLWVEALRSGKYKQGRRRLRNEINEFCCLGVLCNLHAEAHPDLAATQTNAGAYFGETAGVPEVVAQWSGISFDTEVTINKKTLPLWQHNDGYAALDIKQRSFDQIANAIEKQL